MKDANRENNVNVWMRKVNDSTKSSSLVNRTEKLVTKNIFSLQERIFSEI